MQVQRARGDEARNEGKTYDDAEWTASAFDWKDALIGLTTLYGVAGLMVLAEVKLNARTLVYASLPIVVWTIRTRRRVFPGSVRLVKRGVSLAGLFALLSILVGSMLAAFGGANTVAAANAEPAPVEAYRYEWALNTRISTHRLSRFESLKLGDVRLREEPEGTQVIDLDSAMSEPTPEELKRFEEEARLEVEAEARAEFEEDKQHDIEVGLKMALVGLGLILAGALLDMLRPRRKATARA